MPYLPGRPDVAYLKKRLAIFVNGCFWHWCPYCRLQDPKVNSDFWIKKFKTNIDRDAEKRRKLEEIGWKVLTVWECEIKKDTHVKIAQIKNIE